MTIIKLVREVHCVTLKATMSVALRISAAWTMVCTNGTRGSALI